MSQRQKRGGGRSFNFSEGNEYQSVHTSGRGGRGGGYRRGPRGNRGAPRGSLGAPRGNHGSYPRQGQLEVDPVGMAANHRFLGESQGEAHLGNTRGMAKPSRGAAHRHRGASTSRGQEDGRYLAGIMSEEQLQIFYQSDPDVVLTYASHNETVFLNTFKRRNYCKRPFLLTKLIKLLYLLVRSDDKTFVATKLAQILSCNGEYATFGNEIDQLVKKMPFETRGHIRRDNVACIDHLIDIGLEAMQTVPESVFFTFPTLSIKNTIEELTRDGENLTVVFSKFEKLQLEVDAIKIRRMTKIYARKIKPPEDEPPEPFTDLPILPTRDELSKSSEKVYLRPNIVCGGYKSWDHYFDIQFRLLREDFVRPLREGIEAYCSTGSTRNISDIRVYSNARILNPVCLFTGLGFDVKFDVSRLSKVNWEHSRRLIFGSMLCLSNDSFENNFMFATVVKRDCKLLQEGKITVKFEDDSNAFAIASDTAFKMVESTAYFEAYRYILKRLQNLSEIPDMMPMKSYIVDCTTSGDGDVKVPGFMKLRTSRPVFDLKEIIKTKYPFDVTDFGKWPPAHKTDLDDSQLEALKVALTQEIAAIQGPPGTGKTYIGLKIAEAYLRNRHAWDPSKSSPILVVCYTNHALDQFLEGILNFEGLKTNVVRIGGRSKNAALSDCLLREKVQSARADRSVPGGMFRQFKEARVDMSDLQRKIEETMKHCDAEMKNKIIGLSDLRDCMYELHSAQLQYGRPTELNKEIEVWLGLWFPEQYQDHNPEQFPQGSNQEYELYQAMSREEAPLPFVMEDLLQNLPNDNTANDKDEESTGVDDSGDDDLIDVDNEAYVLENERMIEGVDIELPKSHFKPKSDKREKKKGGKSKDGWEVVQLDDNKRKRMMNRGFNYTPMTSLEARRVRDIWSLSEKQKWRLYLCWMKEYMTRRKSEIEGVSQAYNLTCMAFNDAQNAIDCHVAQSADVIGMTTTGAAKYHHLLDSLHPKIAIFEEAAEVLEAHLVTSISSSVQQVILIGDHKQLRPKPTCYDLEKKYNLGVSLFERLVDPKGCGGADFDSSEEISHFPYVTLEVQHRMRPEISKLICPSIYEKLIDDDSVKKYGHVKGVSKDLFFICHTIPEEDNSFNDSKSHVNNFEADYAVQLCLYLLKQGYQPEEITILTMYRGQLLQLRKRMKRDDFGGVRVTAVDDFQGEENEIVILSLVRSNSDSSIGFLSIENRVCVSLSRAKKGFYIIGNGEMLKERHDTKWPEIIMYLEKEHCYGKFLSLYCQNHPGDIKLISKPEDFSTRPEGGCQVTCGERLSCGHSCPRICHIRDSDHSQTRCTKNCNKTFSCGHRCRSQCYQCKKNGTCKPCTEKVEKKLPCGHIVTVNCSSNVFSTPCPVPCDKTLPQCGHKCQNLCSEPCTTRCKVPVVKTLPCEHENKVDCFRDVGEVTCSSPCGTLLQCGDTCEGTCGSCKQGRLHVRCMQKCGRTLTCGHTCDFPCANVCPPCGKPCNNCCSHSQCPKRCYEPCNPCMEPCEWNCPHLKCSKPCGQLCDRPPCNKPCSEVLECGHSCIGLCGELCPDKCRVCDKEEVCELLFGHEEEEDSRFIQLQDCGHIFEVQGFDRWMDSVASQGIIMFKSCPRCKTYIRKSVRYGNHIKKVLLDMDVIKSKSNQQIDFAQLHDLLKKATEDMNGSKNTEFISTEISNISKELKDENRPPRSVRASSMASQLSFLPELLRMKNISDDCEKYDVEVYGYNSYRASCDVAELKRFLMQQILSDQQNSDIILEIRRISCLVKLLDLYGKLCQSSTSVLQQDLQSVPDQMKNLLQSGTKVNDAIEMKCTNSIKTLSEKYHVNGISDEERRQIVAAVGLTKGHWYKCPNGHYYCIGECGGATQKSKCPECKAVIGGSSHTLAAGNAHAGEFDDSRHAAWSDAANDLRNFDNIF